MVGMDDHGEGAQIRFAGTSRAGSCWLHILNRVNTGGA